MYWRSDKKTQIIINTCLENNIISFNDIEELKNNIPFNNIISALVVYGDGGAMIGDEGLAFIDALHIIKTNYREPSIVFIYE